MITNNQANHPVKTKDFFSLSFLLCFGDTVHTLHSMNIINNNQWFVYQWSDNLLWEDDLFLKTILLFLSLSYFSALISINGTGSFFRVYCIFLGIIWIINDNNSIFSPLILVAFLSSLLALCLVFYAKTK